MPPAPGADPSPAPDGDRGRRVAELCDNTGRWGADDQLGTLNLVTPAKRVAAAAQVQVGEVVPLGRPLDTRSGPTNPRPAWHVMHLETERPYASADSLHLQVHGLATTHVDALGHMFLDGTGYGGRLQRDVVTGAGLRALGASAMASGVLTRGVLLDVAAAAGRPWLEAGEAVTPQLLELAERRGGLRVEPGDAVVAHTGLERREAVHGPEDGVLRAGLDVEAVLWLHQRGVALWSGDCIERLPAPPGAVEMPLHQVGIARMGLALLDCPTLTALVAAAQRHRRWEFLLVVAPLDVPGGTGSPVNPLAVF